MSAISGFGGGHVMFNRSWVARRGGARDVVALTTGVTDNKAPSSAGPE